MKNVFKNPKHVMVAGLLIIAVSAVAWQTNDDKKKKDTAAGNYTKGDTAQPKQRNNGKDEFRMKELDNALKQLDIELKHLDLHIKDMDIKISKELKEAFNNIDFDKISKEVENELKKVDIDKITKEVNEEIRKVDMDKIRIGVTNSLKEAQQQMKEIDMQEMKKEMHELQLSLQNGKLKQEIEEGLQDAKQEIQKAKKELQQLKTFTDELEKDGLIDKTKGFSLEWKNGGELYINGKKQPKEVSEKYRKYYKKDGYKINMNNDDDWDDSEGEAI